MYNLSGKMLFVIDNTLSWVLVSRWCSVNRRSLCYSCYSSLIWNTPQSFLLSFFSHSLERCTVDYLRSCSDSESERFVRAAIGFSSVIEYQWNKINILSKQSILNAKMFIFLASDLGKNEARIKYATQNFFHIAVKEKLIP